jgi:hypothetical protein
LHLQFTRIAQLQAQLDLIVGALRRSPDGGSCAMSGSAAWAIDSGHSACREHKRFWLL